MVYANVLCAYQPTRGPAMLDYLFVIASSLQEFSLLAVLVHNVASRHKAALLKLSLWGQIDPLLYSRAFTGPGKAKANATCPLCLGIGHSATAYHLYSEGLARTTRGTAAGPQCAALAQHKICINFNQGQCLRNDCPRQHVCSICGCGSPHASLCCLDKHSPPPPPRRRSNHLPPLSPQSPSPSPPHSPSPSVWHVPQPPSTHAPLTYIPHPHSQSTSTPAPTPINVHALSHLLSALPQQQWVDYLLPGFTYGFLLATRASALLATLPTSHQQLPVQR